MKKSQLFFSSSGIYPESGWIPSRSLFTHRSRPLRISILFGIYVSFLSRRCSLETSFMNYAAQNPSWNCTCMYGIHTSGCSGRSKCCCKKRWCFLILKTQIRWRSRCCLQYELCRNEQHVSYTVYGWVSLMSACVLAAMSIFWAIKADLQPMTWTAENAFFCIQETRAKQSRRQASRMVDSPVQCSLSHFRIPIIIHGKYNSVVMRFFLPDMRENWVDGNTLHFTAWQTITKLLVANRLTVHPNFMMRRSTR